MEAIVKTYFLSWESDNKRGHSIYEFKDEITPREALRFMHKEVENAFPEILGKITATQFNKVD